jgi:hypothetical protein
MANIALNKPADASNYMYPYNPAKGVDGNLTPLSRWVGSSPLPPEPAIPAPTWLRINFGSTNWINRWVVKQMGLLGWSPNDNLTDYKLQGSLDNANWFDIDSVTNNSANSTDRTFNPRKVQWARVYVTKGLRCNTNFASIAELEVYDAPNAPSLTGLTLQTTSGSVPLNPGFSSQTFSYTANVGSTIPSVSVTPTAAVGTIKVNTTTTPSGTPVSVTLNGGTNTITITVTSADNLMTETYTVVVTKGVSSPDLLGLVVSPIRGSLSPTFSSANLNYTANVVGGTTSVTVNPTAVDSQATILVNNTYTVPSGGTSPALNLNVGQNTITIKVTASNGSDIKTYSVVVSRPS